MINFDKIKNRAIIPLPNKKDGDFGFLKYLLKRINKEDNLVRLFGVYLKYSSEIKAFEALKEKKGFSEKEVEDLVVKVARALKS